MNKVEPSSLRNRQMLPLVTQPNTAGTGVPSRSLNSRMATISAAHWPNPATKSSFFASTTARMGP